MEFSMKYCFAFVLTIFMCNITFATTLDEDVTIYIKRFQGDQNLHYKLAEDFQWIGLSDPKLFDLVEKKLMQEFEAAKSDHNERNRVARYIKDLGYSGQEKYMVTLQKFSDNPTYSRYAIEAIKNNPKYRKWNPIISDRSTFDPKDSDEVNRVANMLRADDLELNALGAKRVYFNLFENAYLVDLLAQKVKANFMIEGNASYDVSQAVAWMVKGLGSARDEKYHGLITKIASSGINSTVVSHAKKSLERDYLLAAAPQTRSHTGEDPDASK
jgi:hypothetical protein